MTNDEQIKALIEAGEKATQGEFFTDTGSELMNDKGCVYEYPSDAMFKDKNFHHNSEFFRKAANARDAIKALYEEVVRLREQYKAAQDHLAASKKEGE